MTASDQFFATVRKAITLVGGLVSCILSGFLFRAAFNRADSHQDMLVSLCVGTGVGLVYLGSALINRVTK